MDISLWSIIVQVLDVLIVAYAFYRILLLIKDARAMRLLKGLLILFACYIVSGWLHLTTVNWILGQSWTIILIVIAIIFQPELRSGLERLGNAGNWRTLGKSYSHYDEVVRELLRTTYTLARQRTGALMVLENKTGLQAQIGTGIPIDARISTELLMNLFYNHAPLHDGAVILRGSRIAAASCIMPLTVNKELESRLGTRHRAALGISEVSDAFVIVVSEETGNVSVARAGKLYENVPEKKLEAALRRFYHLDEIQTRRGRAKEDRHGEENAEG